MNDNSMQENDKAGPARDKPAQDREPKRLHAIIRAERYDLLRRIFANHGLNMSEGVRLGLSMAAALLPVLERGGELVSREPDGAERVYVFSPVVN